MDSNAVHPEHETETQQTALRLPDNLRQSLGTSGILTRQEVAKRLGRRVSRGEFERMFSGFRPIVTTVVSNSRGKQTGAPRAVGIRHPFSPKAMRKRDALDAVDKGKRARYAA